MKITVEIEGKKYTVDPVVFRRVLSSAGKVLERLKSADGPMFPETDKKALKWIRDMQFTHRELI